MEKSSARVMTITWITFAAISSIFYMSNAGDPGSLQDFCVGVTEPGAGVYVNGFYCKNHKDVTPDDFLFRGYHKVGDTNNYLGSKIFQVNSTTFPALNTLGVAMARVDFAPGGVNQPHLHPRASEMFAVIEGTLYAGFISSNQQDGSTKHYGKMLHKGDIYVFPQGLIHFQINIGDTPAVAHVAFGSQTPGLVTVANAMLGSFPPIPHKVHMKALQIDEEVHKVLRSKFGDPSLSTWL